MREEESARVENLRPLRFNAVWLVPVLALIVAGWMVYDNWADMGEKILLVAKSAEGIEAGKTKVKVHNVEVGEVQGVRLSENFKQALITVRMKQGTSGMLHSDAKFWVVKPRVGLKGISGLGTVISGAYIEMEPGRKGERISRFKMMSQPPLSTSEDKGIRLRLKSKELAKMSVGTPVHFHGYEVGHIEKVDFDIKTGAINYRIFIQAPYDSLVNDAVQFWLTPVISVKGSARGIEVRMDSLETLFWGGISFGLPRGRKPGKWHDRPVFPTVQKTGVQDIKNGLSAFLHKLNDLKLEAALSDLNSTLDTSKEAFREISGAARSLRKHRG